MEVNDRAREQGHSALIFGCEVPLMKKRVVICFILLFYAVATCGSVLETGCCHDDSAHARGEHASHVHFLAKIHVATHTLCHVQERADRATLTHGHCCCVGPGSGEPGQPPHTFVRQSKHSQLSLNFSDKSATLAILDAPASWLSARKLGSIYSDLTLRSVFSTVLLI